MRAANRLPTDLQPTLGKVGSPEVAVIVSDYRLNRLTRPKCVREANCPGRQGVRAGGSHYLPTSSKSVRSVKSVERWKYKGLRPTDLQPTLPTFASPLLGLGKAERPPTPHSCPLKKRAETAPAGPRTGPANCQLAGQPPPTLSAANHSGCHHHN
jgi:hypothetical protein